MKRCTLLFLPLGLPILLFEIAVIQALEALTVASLILTHLMNSVMDSVKVQLLSQRSDTLLILACTSLSLHTLLQVGLCVPNNLTDQLSELSGVLSLLPSVTLESISYLGITLAICLTAHRQVHTYLSTLAHEVSLQAIPYLFVATFRYAQNVLVNELQSALCLNELFELLFRLFTLRASFGCLISFVYITTYCANPFLFHISQFLKCK